MLKITGYSDKYSAHPGEDVKFYINEVSNDLCNIIQLIQDIPLQRQSVADISFRYYHYLQIFIIILIIFRGS